MNKFRQILDDSLKLADSNQLDQALLNLRQGLREATKENEGRWVVLLAKNAGLLFEKKGRLDRAKSSYRTALKYSQGDPYLHYALGDICQKLGQPVAARRHFAHCQQLAMQQKDKDLIKMLQTNEQS